MNLIERLENSANLEIIIAKNLANMVAVTNTDIDIQVLNNVPL